MSKQTNAAVNETATETTGVRRPTPKQFALGRKLAAQTGNPIPEHALYSAKAMGGYIGTQLRTAS